MPFFVRVRTAGGAWVVLFLLSFTFFRHWDNPVIRWIVWVYTALLVIITISTFVQTNRQKKELERKTADGTVFDRDR